MAGLNQVISAARAKIFFLPPDGGDPVPGGIIEDFTGTNQFNSENFPAIGEFVPPVPGVVNNEPGGQFSWTRPRRPTASENIIKPIIARFAQYQAYGILLLDPTDNKPIALLDDCLPASMAITVSNTRAMRENMTGICRRITHFDEISAG